ncbi:hypothetical protein JTE90_012388 [Oedothorax gibbosus]|uniref:Uncharacterized protein n=1 Tax=Oedothorax gibbosus TaxID=931172 RepID=A0AAV6TWJ3_9ARAC|nr:hypothetical protein JTE90_012388 [Oedothorax gibbosus]
MRSGVLSMILNIWLLQPLPCAATDKRIKPEYHNMPSFTQCNLDRGKAATAELAAPVDGAISDILFLQEPYLDQSGCIGLV